jgi:hypothetical protein
VVESGHVHFTRSAAALWEVISLRRSGRRPLRFEGALVLAAARPPTNDRLGHSVRLFETSDGRMAVAIEQWSLGCHVPTADAHIVRTAEELVEACESFDPRQRMSHDFTLALSGADMDAVAVKAAIEARLELTEADYRSTVLAILRDPCVQPRGGIRPA